MTLNPALTLALLPPAHRGIALALVSTGLFVLVGALVRQLSGDIGVFQILLFRQVVFAVVLVPALVRHRHSLLRPQRVPLHLLRITGAFLALSLSFVALGGLPLADATALGFTQVLFVALIARWCLGEPVDANRWFTLLLGFVGVMMMVRPEFDGLSLWYTLAGLGSALAAAATVICVKRLSKTEPTVHLLAYQALAVGLIALVPALLNWHAPSREELLGLLTVGLLSSVAQWFGVSAYRYAAANQVANVEYVKMLYAMALGYWWFSEVPDLLSWLGVALLLLSVLLPAWRRKAYQTL